MIASSDLQALIRSCRKPWNLVRLITFLGLSIVRTKFLLRLPSLLYYPKQSLVPYLYSLIEVNHQLFLLLPRSRPFLFQHSIKYSSHILNSISSNPVSSLPSRPNPPPNPINDDETASHYYRCSWLTNSSDCSDGHSLSDSIQTLESFYLQLNRRTNKIAFYAYIISERLANVSLFIISNQSGNRSLLTTSLRWSLLCDV